MFAICPIHQIFILNMRSNKKQRVLKFYFDSFKIEGVIILVRRSDQISHSAMPKNMHTGFMSNFIQSI